MSKRVGPGRLRVITTVKAMPASNRKAVYARRRKRRLARSTHDLSDTQWLALCDAWGGCAYCGCAETVLQKDCVLPISRGGRYTLANVVPACPACNASKCNTEVTVWMRRKKFDEKAFLVRQIEIARALVLVYI